MKNVLKTFLLASVPLMFMGCGTDTTGSTGGDNGSSGNVSSGNPAFGAMIHVTALPGISARFTVNGQPKSDCDGQNDCEVNVDRSGSYGVDVLCPAHLFKHKSARIDEDGQTVEISYDPAGSDWCGSADGNYRGTDNRTYVLSTRYDSDGVCRIRGLPINGVPVVGTGFQGNAAGAEGRINGSISTDGKTVQYTHTYPGVPDTTNTLTFIP